MAEIQLSRGFVAVVDPADYEAVLAAGPWFAHVKGRWNVYARKNVWLAGRNGSLLMHTFLTGWPYVDHINGDGLDNRRANLRQANASLNQANRRLGRDNTSGYRGVNFRRERRRWRAYITIDGKRRHLGYFDTPEDAARAYDTAAIAAWGDYARLNFPPKCDACTETRPSLAYDAHRRHQEAAL